jgi:hypothetical protein
MSPIGTPLLISGANSMLRKPRTRAIVLIRRSGELSVSAICTIWPVCATSNGWKSARGRGNWAFKCSSAAGAVGVNAASCATPSTKRNTAVEKPPMSRLELVAMAANTGCTSDGELAMTFRISAVAVCRSSASRVSLNRRAFSMAITAWSANP